MKIRCDYCKGSTIDEEQIIDLIRQAFMESKVTGKPVETGDSCLMCEAPMITITVDAEAGILDEEG